VLECSEARPTACRAPCDGYGGRWQGPPSLTRLGACPRLQNPTRTAPQCTQQPVPLTIGPPGCGHPCTGCSFAAGSRSGLGGPAAALAPGWPPCPCAPACAVGGGGSSLCLLSASTTGSVVRTLRQAPAAHGACCSMHREADPGGGARLTR